MDYHIYKEPVVKGQLLDTVLIGRGVMLVRTELWQPSKKTKLCSYVMCWITDLCYISNEIEGKEDGSVLSLFIVGWLFNHFFWQEHVFLVRL